MIVQRRVALAEPHDSRSFSIVGPLDDSAAHWLRYQLLCAVEDGHRRLSLDVEYVPYITPMGLSVLVEVMSQPGEPIEIELVRVNRAVAAVFSKTKLCEYFPISVHS